MRTCRAHGISHTKFLGGDDVWTDDDRDKAVALQLVEDDRCPGCGNSLTESTDFDLRTEWDTETVTCHPCRVRNAKSEDVGPGEFVVVTRKETISG